MNTDNDFANTDNFVTSLAINIQLAIENNNPEKAEQILSMHVENLSEHYKHRLLQYILRIKKYDTFDLLLKYIDINSRSSDGYTLLTKTLNDIFAFTDINLICEYVSFLLKCGSDVNIILYDEDTAFSILIHKLCSLSISLNQSLRNIIINILILSNGDRIYNGKTPLINITIAYNRYDLLELLLENYHINNDLVKLKALKCALRSNRNYDIAALLIHHINNINGFMYEGELLRSVYGRETLLSWYNKLSYANPEIIELLIENGARL